MNKGKQFISLLYILLLTAPFVVLGLPIQFEFGFYSPFYALLYFFFENFKSITLFRFLAIIVFSLLVLLHGSSMFLILKSKGKKIHILSIIATACEMAFQLYLQIKIGSSSFAPYLSPIVIAILLCGMIYVRLRQQSIEK